MDICWIYVDSLLNNGLCHYLQFPYSIIFPVEELILENMRACVRRKTARGFYLCSQMFQFQAKEEEEKESCTMA